MSANAVPGFLPSTGGFSFANRWPPGPTVLLGPFDPRVMPALLASTPARIVVGRTGPRYRTNTMLRFRADHAASKDAVMSEVDPELLTDLNQDPDFYAEWPDDDVKSFVDDLGIKGNISGRYSRQKGISAITDLADSVYGASSDEPDEPSDEYDNWDDDDLANEIEARAEQGVEIKVSGRKSRQKLIDALRADDAKADPF